MHQAQAVRGIRGVVEADLPRVAALLLVAAALAERVALVVVVDPGVEFSRVAGQHALAGELVSAEGLQQAILGSKQFVVGLGLVVRRDEATALESKHSRKAWEEKQESGKPQRRGSTVRMYQSATSVV